MPGQLSSVVDMLTKYFVDPIRDHSGYNIVNTLTYGIILVVCVYGVLRLLDKLDVKIDKDFIFALLPFMVVGGTARALVDAEVYPDSFLLITPGIYFTIAVITLVSLVVAKALDSKGIAGFTRSLLCIGAIIATLNIILILATIERPVALIYIFGPFLGFYVPIYAISKRYPSFLSGNEYILGAHIFDASTTFCGIQFYGYFEQHVLTGFFIDIFGPAVMFPLKIVFIAVSLYLIETIVPDEDGPDAIQIKNMLKLVIVVLGLGPGIRNMSSILMAA